MSVYGDVGVPKGAGMEGMQPWFVEERAAGWIQMLDKCLSIKGHKGLPKRAGGKCSTTARVYGDVGVLEGAGREGLQPRFVEERVAGWTQMLSNYTVRDKKGIPKGAGEEMLDKCLCIWRCRGPGRCGELVYMEMLGSLKLQEGI